MLISIIVAFARHQVIGKNNQLIWHLPNDLKNFKSKTTGHHIIMGRKTYESIGKPLPNRTNIILSTSKNLVIEGCLVSNSIEEAIAVAQENYETELFVIGGSQIYELALPFADKLYLTKVQAELYGDTFFPIIDYSDWKEIAINVYEKDEKNAYSHTILEYKRISKMPV